MHPAYLRAVRNVNHYYFPCVYPLALPSDALYHQSWKREPCNWNYSDDGINRYSGFYILPTFFNTRNLYKRHSIFFYPTSYRDIIRSSYPCSKMESVINSLEGSFGCKLSIKSCKLQVLSSYFNIVTFRCVLYIQNIQNILKLPFSFLRWGVSSWEQ